jgi:hypothetical protein
MISKLPDLYLALFFPCQTYFPILSSSSTHFPSPPFPIVSPSLPPPSPLITYCP